MKDDTNKIKVHPKLKVRAMMMQKMILTLLKHYHPDDIKQVVDDLAKLKQGHSKLIMPVSAMPFHLKKK